MQRRVHTFERKKKLNLIHTLSLLRVFCWYVSNADRLLKLKQARDDAAKEIKKYKETRESQFQAYKERVRFFHFIHSFVRLLLLLLLLLLSVIVFVAYPSVVLRSQTLGSSSSIEETISQREEAEKALIEKRVESHRQDVIDLLLKYVTEVDTSPNLGQIPKK